ncbi:MAG: adenylate kinase family protein [Luteolibacter sp.]
MRILLLGPPASGKGTQGRKLAESLGLRYLSTGALLRKNVERKTPLGLEVEKYLNRGDYVPDDLITPILIDWLEQHPPETGWVLDGYPRSLSQAQSLDAWLAAHSLDIHFAVSLEVPEEELLNRISSRVECPSCHWSGQFVQLNANSDCPKCGAPASRRADDGKENFHNRYQKFTQHTLPVINHYKAVGKLIPVPATAPKEEVAQSILSAVGGT